ncbi:MAG: protein kinase [Acidobacteriota bacterium]
MTPERYQQINELLDVVLKLEPSRQRAFLDQACAGDESLRREVESLLAAHEQAMKRDFIETPAAAKFAEMLASDQSTEVTSDKPMILNERYVIERELGRGGFGVVYLARDLKLLSRFVVVKVLQPKAGRDRYQVNEYLKRKFRDEIDALTRFRHPHIVGILDQGEMSGGDPFLVMEFIEGISLRSVMKSEGMERKRVAHLIRQVSQALNYAHERFVSHRDLKPENIMLQTAVGEEFVSLIDFGIATVGEWQSMTRGGQTTRVIGTPDYMAPEQIQRAPSEKSDIWALGVIAYEILTGQRPFSVPYDKQTNTPLLGELYEMQQAGVQVKPRDLRPELPEAAQSAILKSLSFDPQARHAQVRDFGEELAAALTGEETAHLLSFPTEKIASEPVQQPTDPTTATPVSSPSAEVVISHCAQDLRRARQIAESLKSVGIECWMADHGHEISINDRSETIRALRQCRVVLLLCSDAALRSHIIKQDLQLAWRYERHFLPLLIEPISFAQQTDYWLEGKQWIEATDSSPEQWLSPLLQALGRIGVHFHETELTTLQAGPVIQPTRLDHSLQSLRAVACFTDQIWPIPAKRLQRVGTRSALRGLGAPQDDVQHDHRLGSRVCLAIESDRAGYMLLLDEGPEGIIYCLCPSWFAPDTSLRPERSYLPQMGSRYDSFVVTGTPGREHLLAIVSDEPLGLDWLPSDSRIPARVLNEADVDMLLARLRGLEGDRWTALSTYFDVVA